MSIEEIELHKDGDYRVTFCEECWHWKGFYTHDYEMMEYYLLTCVCEGIKCKYCSKIIRYKPDSYSWGIDEEEFEFHSGSTLHSNTYCHKCKCINEIFK